MNAKELIEAVVNGATPLSEISAGGGSKGNVESDLNAIKRLIDTLQSAASRDNWKLVRSQLIHLKDKFIPTMLKDLDKIAKGS